MVRIPFVLDWEVCTPIMFRYLPGEFVTEFFEDGKLRLSSFNQFAQHTDEQRLDPQEGRIMFTHLTKQRGGQTIVAWSNPDLNAYVLCGTMRHSAELMEAFGSESYIRINNTTGFGQAISRHIPGNGRSFEGPCVYQEKVIVERDLGWIDPGQFRDEAHVHTTSPFRCSTTRTF